MVENEAERRARIAGEEVRRLREVLESIRNGEIEGTYLNLKTVSGGSDYIGKGVNDVEDV